ncbi:MAG: hypothetical protein ACREHD_12250, partial [Pirellulales bacterium]
MYARSTFFACCFLLVVFMSTRPCRADEAAKLDSPPPASAEFIVTGTVLLPDGRPAAGAIVRSYDRFDHSQRATTADRLGKFELPDPCLSGLRLHATSPDGRNQAVLLVPEEAVRSSLSQPLTIVLEPAKPHQVVVTAKGRPIEGAHVSVGGNFFDYVSLHANVTGADGAATLWFPAGETMLSVVAWHPRHGVDGISGRAITDGDGNTEFSLPPPGPHVVRVVDRNDRPVAGATIAASLSLARFKWLYPSQISATRATTDQNGEVHWDWFPAAGVKYVNVHLLDRGWKTDSLDNDRTTDGVTTIHVRRKFPVQGRLILPDGANAEGILITGSGFGPGSYGDDPQTRTRADGSFTMDVPAGYGYSLAAYDSEWTSGIWSGAITPLEGEPQREIVLHGERATPLEVVVTSGPSREPVKKAQLHVSRRGDVKFTLETGKSLNGLGLIGGWVQTDENGRARAAVGRGEIRILLPSSGDREETEQTVRVESEEPVHVAFHVEPRNERRTAEDEETESADGDTEADETPVEPPLAERIRRAVENCRVMGMRVLMVLEGNDSERVKYLAGRLAEGDAEAIYRYLPIRLTARERSENSPLLTALKCPSPAAGEVVMVVTADGKEASASIRLTSADLDDAFRRGSDFLDKKGPPVQDGRERLKRAKSEAADSDRTVWVITGGPRCGPCFLLARWIDQHHDVLEKDLVIVKLTHGIDTHANEI